ncbi:5-formyltetrahydrofolate cyclo-ligase [Brevibacterium sp. FME17]|uniref:5-formyltetrahydrofolate cyclo-ligase n=1 Tax=Brevibacterium sp. FME17 TaxID=2742606 RepID=UPI001866BFF0|nr:5-formyltetrahydrofolate cyclo-ligase [Brevibacterium sp. FME17]
MGVDAETSKAQLRARIRYERAARAATAPESRGVEAEPSVAESAWALVESLWPDLDLNGRSMLAYAALAGEPDMDPVVDRFLAHGGTVYLPVVTTVGQPLMFGAVTESMATLEPRGKWGIREPSPALSAVDLLAEVAPDIMFVPALGFGPEGARLGNGGGFYDRTFGPHGEVPMEREDRMGWVFGVCFSTELGLPGLAVEAWDLQITSAVTDHGVHSFD